MSDPKTVIGRARWIRPVLLAILVAGAALRVDWALEVPARPVFDAKVYLIEDDFSRKRL